MKQILIVEDNKDAVLKLKSIIGQIPVDTNIQNASNVDDALRIACITPVDLFIVDVVLKGDKDCEGSGYQFVKAIRDMKRYTYIPIIFTTNVIDKEQLSFKKWHCYNYLEKPYDDVLAREEITSALKMFDKDHTDGFWSYRINKEMIFENMHNIIYIKFDNKCVVIKTKDSIQTIYYKTLKAVKEEINDKRFIQCGRNLLVNRDYIKRFEFKTGMLYLAEQYGEFEIGRIYKRRIAEELQK